MKRPWSEQDRFRVLRELLRQLDATTSPTSSGSTSSLDATAKALLPRIIEFRLINNAVLFMKATTGVDEGTAFLDAVTGALWILDDFDATKYATSKCKGESASVTRMISDAVLRTTRDVFSAYVIGDPSTVTTPVSSCSTTLAFPKEG